MPVGPWPDFDACVAAMDGKVADAPAFCNWAERNMTATMKGAEGQALRAALDRLPEDARPAAREAYVAARERLGATHDAALVKAIATPEFLGWQRSGGAWTRRFRAPVTRTVAGVEVFAVGTWTDSAGEITDWTLGDLQVMVAASKAGVPQHIPVKAGHTQDGFNARLAEALGVPQEIVTGQKGQGQIALGEVVNLRLEGDKLIGDFADVPGPVADLIESRGHSGFTNVSAEIDFDMKAGDATWARVLSGVALLGAEAPAVESLAGLEAALVFSAPDKGRRAYRMMYGAERGRLSQDDLWAELDIVRTEVEKALSGKSGRTVMRAVFTEAAERLRGLFAGQGKDNKGATKPGAVSGQTNTDSRTHQEGNMLEKLKQMLGLAPEATEEQVLAAVAAMREQMAGMAKDTAAHAAFAKEAEGLQKRITDLEARNASLEHRERVAKYAVRAATWKHLKVKPDETGEALAGIEEKAGAEVAEQVAAQHDAAAEAFKNSAMFTRVSNPRSGEPDGSHPLEKEMAEWAAKNGKSVPQAYAHFQQTHPDKFREFQRAAKAENHSGA